MYEGRQSTRLPISPTPSVVHSKIGTQFAAGVQDLAPGEPVHLIPGFVLVPGFLADAQRIASLRNSGASWRIISREVGVTVRTVRRLAGGCGTNLAKSQMLNP